MTLFFITGTSRGIGKALAEQLLSIETNLVYGFSRTCTIEGSNYKHVFIDLSKIDEVKELFMPRHSEAERVVLVNNAGMLGEAKPFGRVDPNTIVDTLTLNMLTPMLLTHKLLESYSGSHIPILVINISSGAARHPIESWATYCASKAAIDMFSQVVQAENGYDVNGTLRVFSVAPGIVDTDMQTSIRASKPEDFPHLDKFVGYKEKGQLLPPQEAARRLIEIINRPSAHQNVLLDLRQL